MLYKVKYSESDYPDVILSAVVNVDSENKTESEIFKNIKIRLNNFNRSTLPAIIISIKKYKSNF